MLRVKIFQILIICCVFILMETQLTLPMKILHHQAQFNLLSKKNVGNHLHRLESQNNQIETYKLRPQQYFFSLTVKVGGFAYDLNIDTGSSDFFIKGQDTKGEPKIKYSCKQCIQKNQKFFLNYLDGGLETYEKKIQVEIGQHKFNESVLVAFKIDNQNFNDDGGIIGLSFPSLAINKNPNFLSTLIKQKIVKKYAFGVNLNFKNKQNSFITFGTYDLKFFSGTLSYFDIISINSFIIESKGISIGEGQLLKISSSIFDTGNTCISIPRIYQQNILLQFQYTDIKNKIKSGNKCFFQKQVNVPMFSLLRCKVTKFQNLPIVVIHLGEQKFNIQKEYYIQKCDKRQNQEDTYYCQSYIQSVQHNQLFLGDGFFNRFYTYFDLEENKLGIAKNKQQIKLNQVLSNNYIKESEWKTLLEEKIEGQNKNNIFIQCKNFFFNLFSGF